MSRSTLLSLLCCLALACGEGPSSAPQLHTLTVSPDSVDLAPGATAQLTAVARDQDSNVLSGPTISWSTSDANTATVSTTGFVQGAGLGRAIIRASAGARRDSAVINVFDPSILDYSIEAAQFTQGIQTEDGSIPIVLGGNAAVVNVLVRNLTRASPNTRLPVVLRLYDHTGSLFHTDTVLSRQIGRTSSWAAPSAQFLVHPDMFEPGITWQVEADPLHTHDDIDRSNNTFPRTDHAILATAIVPPLHIRFVPITLAAHGGTTPVVLQSHMAEYLRVLRSVHPIASVTTSIASPIVSNASFGTGTSGGEASFWLDVLSTLDLARVTDSSDPDSYWYGLVLPPAGFGFTAFGGFAYIPSFGQSTGPGTRTAASVAVGWFNNPIQSRELVAHELGHNFGRRHAPCGAAANPDPAFPYPGGTIGSTGHNVFAWFAGNASSAAAIPGNTGDVMGYCLPSWSSDYTYRGVLDFRGPGTVAVTSAANAERTEVLIIRGVVYDDGRIDIEPLLVLDGGPSRPERSGAYRLEGRADDGRILFAYDFEPAVIDHAPDAGTFLFALDLPASDRNALARVDVRGPMTAAGIERSSAMTVAGRGTIRRNNGLVRVSCADPASRGIALLDEAGSLLATASGSSAQIDVRSGARITAVCSDGIRATRNSIAVP